jgi:hypothetical protein
MHGNKATRKKGSKNVHVVYSETLNKQLISDTNVLVNSISSRTSFNSGSKVQADIVRYVLCPKRCMIVKYKYQQDFIAITRCTDICNQEFSIASPCRGFDGKPKHVQ